MAKTCVICCASTANSVSAPSCQNGANGSSSADHVERDGESLFRLVCEHDLEGVVVAKHRSDPCLPDRARWVKIPNREYSQWVGREELFERDRAMTSEAALCPRALRRVQMPNSFRLLRGEMALLCQTRRLPSSPVPALWILTGPGRKLPSRRSG
jgi:hypothetical protein